MRKEDNSDLISSEMARIMQSDEHKKVFGAKMFKKAQENVQVSTPEEAARMNKLYEQGGGQSLPPGQVAQAPEVPAPGISQQEVAKALQSAVSGFDPAAKAAAEAVIGGSLPEGAVDVLAPFFKGRTGVEVSNALKDYVNAKETSAVTAVSAINDLVKIANYLADKNHSTSEALANQLIQSIYLEERKAMRKAANNVLESLAEDYGFGTTAEPTNSNEDKDKEESEDEPKDENDKSAVEDDGQDELDEDKAMLEDDTDDSGEGMVVPY